MSEPGEIAATQTLPPGVYCPSCSYDLRGATEDRCSECGYSLAGLRSSASGIPWSHRKKLGRFKTYWQTVWMVTFKNRRFCEEYAKKVDYLDARKFQWVTVLHVVVAAIVATFVSVEFGYPDLPLTESPWETVMEFVGMPVMNWEDAHRVIWQNVLFFGCFVLFVLASTGVPSYYFHPPSVSPERQNRGIALSYYTCAPLSIAVFPMIGVAAIFVHGQIGCLHVQVLFLFAASSTACIVLAWWLNLVRVAKRTMASVPRKAAVVGVTVPLLWSVLGCVILVGIPFAVLSILVLIASLG